jgi:hypothetical protein
MLKQDYILRLIEQVAQALRLVAGSIKTEEPAVAQQDLDEALMDLTGLTFDLLDSLPLASVLTILDSHSEPNPARILAIAECSFVRAQLAEASNRSDLALRVRVTALTLYLEALTLFRHEAVADAEARAEELILAFQSFDLPRETVLRLFRFRTTTGRFADAENALFDLLEREPKAPDLLEEGTTFYRRLLTLTDVDLEAGNLPRDEVTEGLEELERTASA